MNSSHSGANVFDSLNAHDERQHRETSSSEKHHHPHSN